MTTIQSPPRTDTGIATHLEGGWLWAARVVWLIVVILGVGLFIAAIPTRYQQLHGLCTVAPCPPSQISPQGVELLAGWGISLDDYALAWVIPEALTLLFYLPVVVLIFWRRSDDWMALFVSLALFLNGVGGLPPLAAIMERSSLLALLVNVLFLLTEVSGILLLFLFPDGRLVPRWTRWLALPYLAVSVANVLTRESAFGLQFGLLPLLLALFTGVIAQVYRYRRVSGPTERQQTKWAVFGFAIYVGALFLVTVPIALFPSINPATTVIDRPGQFIYMAIALPIIYLATYALPVFVAISVLRYRLWDVDFVINRSLVYGAMTVSLVGVFGIGFFGFQALLSRVLGTDLDIIAAAVPAVIATALFNPVRRGLRSFVDRRFYGIQIDYATPPRHEMAQAGRIASIGGYTHLNHVASGGMGEVYRAMHPELKRSVAVKVLSKRLADEKEFQRRFEREAQVVTSLKHPNIVQLFEYGQENEMAYMVMEFIEGTDLSQMIKALGRLPFEQVRGILGEITSALDYAHGHGIVHRDIKPSNVMLEPIRGTDGEHRAVLMDFGIAKIATGGTRLTFSGMVGTLDYIAPEQIQGAAEVDRRADIYALGVMTYQMLTGELPFRKNNPGALVLAHLLEPPPDACGIAPDLPHGVCAALQRAMAKKPTERFDSAGSMLVALE